MMRGTEEQFGEPLDEEERVLMDPDTWDWEAAQVLPATKIGAVLAIRLSREELARIGQAARAEGITLTEFVKQSALLRALHGAPR
jgi:hypothetical protein